MQIIVWDLKKIAVKQQIKQTKADLMFLQKIQEDEKNLIL